MSKRSTCQDFICSIFQCSPQLQQQRQIHSGTVGRIDSTINTEMAEEPPRSEDIANKMEDMVLGEDGKPLSKAAIKKLEKQREKDLKKAEVAARLAAEKAARDAASPDYSVEFYGKLPMNQSATRLNEERTSISSIGERHVGKTLLVSARVQTSRPTGSKMLFLTLRQGTFTLQTIMTVDAESVSKQMLKFSTGITPESLVLVSGEVTKVDVLITGCTVQEYELKIRKRGFAFAFTLEDATRPDSDFTEDSGFSKINLDTRLDNRVIDLRTTTNQAIFRIQAGVSRFFREFLDNKDFVEIHTPKLIAAASEGGANVFRVSYFKESGFLAQSPQLYKQMMVCADFERVYEIGPVFRAENSQTHRHMTEFMGLDMEMAFQEHYHEVLDVLDGLFVRIFDGLKEKFQQELATIQSQYPFDEFKYLPKSLRLEFPEAIQMLRDANVEIGDFDDFNTAQERLLGKLVREKYNTDFFILDKFPLAVRPFYTMPDPQRPGYSNSYDFFIRGEEIMSGAQRIHDPSYLKERAEEHGVDISTIQPYIDAFKYGAPPHAGGGIGLERVVMLYLDLGNIRKTSLFPRDPKRLTP
ncbi:aspartate-tRNA(Asn) ligase [Batrachochytrium salamandrivorans]|nr:aspartate-tRNA(Asn) ligase [Batrachochytrium salamandrivorans]